MNDAFIRHLVNRFLAWKLPENFNPDGGISFKKTFNDHTPHPMKAEPVGTNLFDATQAEAMVRHMLEGSPVDDNAAEILRLTRERDVAVGERVARAKTMKTLYEKILPIRDEIEDETDRVYFGSTNDADAFREIVEDLESWVWHDLLRDTQKHDPFEASRNAIARADALHEQLKIVRDAQDGFFLGQAVTVSEGCKYHSDWRGTRLFIAGIDIRKDAVDFTLSENWPPKGLGDLTDGWSASDLCASLPEADAP